MNKFRGPLLAGLVTVGFVLSACVVPAPGAQKAVSQPPAPAPAVQQPAAAQQPVVQQPAAAQQPPAQTAAQSTVPTKADYVGKFELSNDRGIWGDKITVTASGLPANAKMDLLWYTAEGSWDIRGPYNDEYHGRVMTPATRTLANITTDAKGSFEHTFSVPEDFGFWHDVAVVQNDVIRNKAAFYVDMQVSISPQSGPVGTPITIEVKGIGATKYEMFWKVFYDNKDVGMLSAITTNGHAKAVIPAVGKPGKHIIQIIEGAFTFAYRNHHESPYKHLLQYPFEFEITPGDPVLPPPPQAQAYPPVPGTPPPGTGLAVWANPAATTVGAPMTVHGRGLPPNKPVELQWSQIVGNRVGSGYREGLVPLGKATTDAQGNLTFTINTPDDLGGLHRIEVHVDGQKVDETKFKIMPSALSITPASGPVGTEFLIKLKGGGWTETENIFTVVYDNAHIGYICAFNSQGSLNLYLKATGDPGWHFIDLYPGIYKGKEPIGVETFRIPQLTYNDHPGEKIPAFRFAFLITE